MDLRIDPRLMLPGARTIIVVADRYAPREDEMDSSGAAFDPPEDSVVRCPNDVANGDSRSGLDEGAGTSLNAAALRPLGRIARYARGDDYHLRLKKRLITLADRLAEAYPDAGFRAAVDTAPVHEREHAVRAGLGYIGRNTLVIRPGTTSYFFLGEVLTTLDLPLSEPVRTDHCGTCRRCVEACPTGALDEPYRLDATKCISYLTIEHRSAIDEQRHAAIGDWLFGCDICQEVCPHNGGAKSPPEAFAARRASRASGEDEGPSKRAAVGEREAGRRSQSALPPIPRFYMPRREGFDLLSVLNWTEADRRTAFVTSAMKRAKLEMMQRNALIVAGNYIIRAWQAGLLTSDALASPGEKAGATVPGLDEDQDQVQDGDATTHRTVRALIRRITELAENSTTDTDLVRQTAQATLDRIRRLIAGAT